MAKVIIGGQMLCLLLTLLVTPVSYSIFDDWGRGVFRRKRTA
jgi:HAE1 family hydrophobic/amphiphilic exporter-1